MSFRVGKIADIEDVIISNTGYTGVGGFELYFKPREAKQIWNAVFDAGNEFGIKPIGLGARDTLRLEAGLGWITRFTEGNQFISLPILERQKTEGITRQLVGFEMLGKGIALGYVQMEYAIVGTLVRVCIRDKKIEAVVVKPPFRR